MWYIAEGGRGNIILREYITEYLNQINHINSLVAFMHHVSYLNPLSLHDALKHHFTSLKTHLIFLQPRALERKFPSNWFTNIMVIFSNC